MRKTRSTLGRLPQKVQTAIVNYAREHTLLEAVNWIRQTHGISISDTALCNFLKKRSLGQCLSFSTTRSSDALDLLSTGAVNAALKMVEKYIPQDAPSEARDQLIAMISEAVFVGSMLAKDVFEDCYFEFRNTWKRDLYRQNRLDAQRRSEAIRRDWKTFEQMAQLYAISKKLTNG